MLLQILVCVNMKGKLVHSMRLNLNFEQTQYMLSWKKPEQFRGPNKCVQCARPRLCAFDWINMFDQIQPSSFTMIVWACAWTTTPPRLPHPAPIRQILLEWTALVLTSRCKQEIWWNVPASWRSGSSHWSPPPWRLHSHPKQHHTPKQHHRHFSSTPSIPTTSMGRR